MREKVGKSRKTVFFQWFGTPEGRKVGLLKRRARTTFGSWDVEKVYAVVARSTFRSQNSKCTKHTILGPLLEVQMSKKCTPLWREAHFQVKMYKARHSRTTFGSWDVEKVHAVVARSTFRSQNVQSTPCTDHFWRFRCRFAWQAQGVVDLVKSEQNVRVLHFQLQPPLHHTTLQYITLQLQLHLHYILLHYTPLHYTALNYTQLHYTTLQYTTLRYTTLHYTTLINPCNAYNINQDSGAWILIFGGFLGVKTGFWMVQDTYQNGVGSALCVSGVLSNSALVYICVVYSGYPRPGRPRSA